MTMVNMDLELMDFLSGFDLAVESRKNQIKVTKKHPGRWVFSLIMVLIAVLILFIFFFLLEKYRIIAGVIILGLLVYAVIRFRNKSTPLFKVDTFQRRLHIYGATRFETPKNYHFDQITDIELISYEKSAEPSPFEDTTTEFDHDFNVVINGEEKHQFFSLPNCHARDEEKINKFISFLKAVFEV